MKRHLPGLHRQTRDSNGIPEGVFLTRVERASYCYHPQKPFFTLQLAILEPEPLAGRTFSGRLYCTPKALWKLSWFLRDFGYDEDLMEREEVDEKALPGLRGVVKVSHTTLNGRCYLNLDGFAPEAHWEELSVATVTAGREESGDDL